jgi:tetraacyldisaccharide 4'-kinase
MLRAPAFWWNEPGLAANLLAPAAALYGAVAAQRLAGRGVRAAVPVICVGDPTLGGGGKTPTVIALAKFLRAAGEKPFIISRGYGGRLSDPTEVDPARVTAGEVGDEPLLLAAVAPTVVAHDRVAGAKLAVARGASALLLDDGFQNPSVAKDCSLLVVDGESGLGNGRVFPAGPLRAPLAAQLARAQAAIVVGNGEAGKRAATWARSAGVLVLQATLVPDPAAARSLARTRVLAFAGIARPAKFFNTLSAIGADVVVRHAFPDHHRYSASDANALLAEARANDLQLVTTEKDLVRMKGDPALAKLMAQALALPVRVEFADTGTMQNLLADALKRARG